MSTELTTENRATGTRDRSPLTWLVAAAAVVIIAGVGLFAVLAHDEDPAAPPAAGDDRTTVTELAPPSPEAYAARCMVPNAETLSQQEVAVDATVTTIADGVVTLTVGQWYAGDPTDVVRVQAPEEEMQELVGAVDFQEDGRYLVSATDGRVTVCGFSAPWSEDLAALYTQAFE